MGAAGSAVEALKNRSNAKYEILRVVNRGGMGEIALGRVVGTKGFEKLVVLKRLRADAERADHRAMFDVEAELMSRIEHPNIVQVFDQPIIENVPYLAMAYVRRDDDLDPQRAIASLEKALELDRTETEAFYYLGQLYLKTGQRDKAIAAWREYVVWSDNPESVDKVRTWLRDLEQGSTSVPGQ